MRVARSILLVFGLVTLPAAWSADHRGGEWLRRVPAEDRVRQSPLPQDPGSGAAGAELFHRHCASCHGADAGGIGRRPSLRTERVHSATEGELQWLLRNGSLARGMPPWASLPEAQRWQLVQYLHTLPLDP